MNQVLFNKIDKLLKLSAKSYNCMVKAENKVADLLAPDGDIDAWNRVADLATDNNNRSKPLTTKQFLNKLGIK